MMTVAASMIFAFIMLVAFENISVGVFMTLVGLVLSLANYTF